MSSQQLMLELINRDNAIKFRDGELIYQTPETTTEHDRNTKMMLKAHTPGRFTGEVEIFYNRKDVAEAFVELGVDHPEVLVKDSTTLEDTLASLKARYNLDLTVDEIAEHVIDEDEVLLEIAPTCIALIGTVVVKRVEEVLELEEALPNDLLNGFYAPGKIPPSQ